MTHEPDDLLVDHRNAAAGSDPALRFMGVVMDRLRQLVDAGAGTFSTYDERGRTTSPMVVMLPPGVPLEFADRMMLAMARGKVAQQTPLAIGPEAYGRAPVVSDAELRFAADGSLSTWGAFVDALGVVSNLALLLRRINRPIGTVLLSRMSGQDRFDPAARERVLQLQPLIEAGFALAYTQFAIAERARGLCAGTLTAREIEIIGLVGEGATNQAVADQLGVSLATVKTHLYNAYGKLGVTSRGELIALYRHSG
jgi:DNA-binding CsgD family transcriptional regulator